MDMRILQTSILALSLGLLPIAARAEGAAPAQGAYGQALSKQAPVSLAKVLADPDAYANKTVVVDGTVRVACKKAGCWMELATSGEKAGQGCRVTMKDHAFFVPTDSAGSTARVEGVVSVRTVPKDEVAHLESEGGSFAKKDKDGSAREVRIVASGVELKRSAK